MKISGNILYNISFTNISFTNADIMFNIAPSTDGSYVFTPGRLIHIDISEMVEYIDGFIIIDDKYIPKCVEGKYGYAFKISENLYAIESELWNRLYYTYYKESLGRVISYEEFIIKGILE